MQYLSARQMWHDAFYSRSANDQLLEINRSNANLLRQKPVMNETQTRGPADNASRVMHMVKAGRVQSEIAKLPEHLQAFGMYCWAPKTQDSLPNYKHQNEIANALAQEIKEAFPREYAYYTSRVSIVVLNVLKYEFERDKGRKPQSIDITLAGAMAMSKDKVRAQWGHIVKHIRNCIREMQLEADPSKHLSVAALNLATQWKEKAGGELTPKHSAMALLVIKSFAHKDQAFIFSASEDKEPVTYRKSLYTQEYLSWRIGIAQANWKRDGWQEVFDEMLRICEEWAREALEPIVKIKLLTLQ